MYILQSYSLLVLFSLSPISGSYAPCVCLPVSVNVCLCLCMYALVLHSRDGNKSTDTLTGWISLEDINERINMSNLGQLRFQDTASDEPGSACGMTPIIASTCMNWRQRLVSEKELRLMLSGRPKATVTRRRKFGFEYVSYRTSSFGTFYQRLRRM